MIERDDWILVTSEGELATGMAILESPCSGCGRAHVGVLLRQEPGETFCGQNCYRCVGWYIANPCDQGAPQCLRRELMRGHLYRLRPDTPAASDEMSRPAKAREMERAGR